MISVDERRMDNVGCSNASEYFLDNISRVYEKLVATRMTEPMDSGWPRLESMPDPRFQNWAKEVSGCSAANSQLNSLFAKAFVTEGFGTESMPPIEKLKTVSKFVPSKLNREWFEDAYNVIFNFIETPHVSSEGWIIHSPEISGCTTMRDVLIENYQTDSMYGCGAAVLDWKDSAQGWWDDFLGKIDSQPFTRPGLPASLCGALLGHRSFFGCDEWFNGRTSIGDFTYDWYNYDCIEPINRIYSWLTGVSGSDLYPTFVNYCERRAPNGCMADAVVDLGCGSEESGIPNYPDTRMLYGGDAQAALCRADRSGCGRVVHTDDSLLTGALSAEVPTMRLVAPSVYRMAKLASIAGFGGFDDNGGSRRIDDHYVNVTVSTDELRVKFPHKKRVWKAGVKYSYSLTKIDEYGPGWYRYDVSQDPFYEPGVWTYSEIERVNECSFDLSKDENLDPRGNPFKTTCDYELEFGDLSGVSTWDGCLLTIKDPDTLRYDAEKNVARGLIQLFTDNPAAGCFEYVGCLLRGTVESVQVTSGSGESVAKVTAVIPDEYGSFRSKIESPSSDLPISSESYGETGIRPVLFSVLKRHISSDGGQTDEYAGYTTNGFNSFLACVADISYVMSSSAVSPLEREGYDRYDPDSLFRQLPSRGEFDAYAVSGSGCVEFADGFHITKIEPEYIYPDPSEVWVMVLGKDSAPRRVAEYKVELNINVFTSEMTNYRLAKDFNGLFSKIGTFERGIPVDGLDKLGHIPEVTVKKYPSTSVSVCPTLYGFYKKEIK